MGYLLSSCIANSWFSLSILALFSAILSLSDHFFFMLCKNGYETEDRVALPETHLEVFFHADKPVHRLLLQVMNFFVLPPELLGNILLDIQQFARLRHLTIHS